MWRNKLRDLPGKVEDRNRREEIPSLLFPGNRPLLQTESR